VADAAELRRALATFLGDAPYRKFVQEGVQRGRMRYWQEQAWDRFTSAHPEFAVGPDELVAALRVCHLHGDELRPDTAEVFHGNMDLAQWYVEARAQLFPNAAQDVVSTEGVPFEGDRIGVWFCPSCRVARAVWETRRRR
jgi:hypothetical protein